MNNSIKNAILFLGICMIISSFGMNAVNGAENCNVTQEDWEKSSSHGKYKTLEDFKKACEDLLTQGQVIGEVLPLGAILCIVVWAITTFRKEKQVNPSSKEFGK
jgi:hypothetical protein